MTDPNHAALARERKLLDGLLRWAADCEARGYPLQGQEARAKADRVRRRIEAMEDER